MSGGVATVIGALERLLFRVQKAGHHAVVVSGTGGSPYAQFLVEPGCDAYAEAVSNDYLLEDAKLDRRQRDALLRLGWRAPDDPDHPAARDDRNYWQRWPAPVDLEAAATIAIISLFEVYGVGQSDLLEVQVIPGMRNAGRQRPQGAGFGLGRARHPVDVESAESD